MAEVEKDTYLEIINAQVQVNEAISRLNSLKEQYRDQLVHETTQSLMKIQAEEGKLNESDIKLFLSRLSIRSMQLI